MFKATDFKLIRRDCPEELKKLLQLLKIPMPNFNSGDEYEIYSKLDKAIDKEFCERLHCKSDLDGYAKLLDLGGIKFDSGETRNNMLKKVLANRDKILQGAAAQVGNKNSSSDSDLSLWARIVRFFKRLFGSDESAPSRPSDKLSRAQIEKALPILEQVNKIFNAI
ncbi:MAG: hypothetical protein SR1Q5_04755 [Quinella sp. 1Q5]|nr:hypothetical protein [Quinella sp. 1Q5]